MQLACLPYTVDCSSADCSGVDFSAKSVRSVAVLSLPLTGSDQLQHVPFYKQYMKERPLAPTVLIHLSDELGDPATDFLYEEPGYGYARSKLVLRQYYHERHTPMVNTLKMRTDLMVIPLGYNARLFDGNSSVLAAKAALTRNAAKRT